MHPHLTRHMSKNNMTILELNLKGYIWERFEDSPFYFDYFLCTCHNVDGLQLISLPDFLLIVKCFLLEVVILS